MKWDIFHFNVTNHLMHYPFICSWATVHASLESQILFIRTEHITRRIDTISILLTIETRLTWRSFALENDRTHSEFRRKMRGIMCFVTSMWVFFLHSGHFYTWIGMKLARILINKTCVFIICSWTGWLRRWSAYGRIHIGIPFRTEPNGRFGTQYFGRVQKMPWINTCRGWNCFLEQGQMAWFVWRWHAYRFGA